MRKPNKRKLKNSIVVIVDGNDEKWYIEKIKEHYPSNSLKEMSVKPEFPQKKNVEDLFALAETKANEEFSHVILILDMDNILKDSEEFQKFQERYNNYCNVQDKNQKLTKKQQEKHGWMERLLLILNTPCLEFWYLLHFCKTTRFFPDYNALKPTLKKIRELKDYEKHETYYKQNPDIYNRLGGLDGIKKACKNAQPFSLNEAKNKGVSEMNLFFNFFDELDKGTN